MAIKQVQTQEGINPQIIPMIDIMFLLLLFFMLGADMGHRELEDVRLPIADGVVAEGKEQARPITVNCYHLQPNDVPCRAYETGGISAGASLGGGSRQGGDCAWAGDPGGEVTNSGARRRSGTRDAAAQRMS